MPNLILRKLLNNVLLYAEQQGWTDPEDLYSDLNFMLGGTIGLTESDIRKAIF